MSIQLFSHNQTAYDSALTMLEACGKAAIVHPTGTGKSFIAFQLCEEKKSDPVCWLSPSEYIYKTQIENLKKAGGEEPANVRFYTYAKLMQMTEEELSAIEPAYIVLDEFHRCGAEMWGAGVRRLLETFPKAKILGLSATAIRYLDNQRDMAEELFDGNIASEMTLGEAIVRGILKSPTYILSVYSYQNDLKKYQKRIAGAKSRAVRDEAEKYYEALRRALEQADGLDVIFQKHIQSKNSKYIVFCANAEHMREMIDKVPEWFGEIDGKPHIYSVYSDDPETSKAFADFKADASDHLKLLFCIDMLNEGVHVEKIDGVILFRPTVSPIIYKQQIGRALSASKDREPIIFDIVNNIENLYSIGAIEQEMQIAANYYRMLGIHREIVSERFRIVDEVQNVRWLFDQLNETLTASWDMMYACAKKYYETEGNLEVPRRYKTAEGYSLGDWIFTQRSVYRGDSYGTLDAERIRKLEAIGMIWDGVRDLSWQRYFAEVKSYFAEHGDLNVPHAYQTKSGVDLAAWIRRIRTYRKSGIQNTYLTGERIALLDEMGMIWSVPDYLWEANFAGALDFYRENGHLDIPAEYCTPDGLKIGTWIRRQRALRSGKIKAGTPPTDEQIARLDEIGMIWKNQHETAWDTGYQAALAYYNEHGNLNVPTSYVTPDGYKLGAWIADRREKGKEKHSEKQQNQLDVLGMIWTKPDPWEVRYDFAKQFYEKHGNLNLPGDYQVQGIWLAKWLNEQRQIYIGNRGEKKLTEEQINRLEQIGMVWENRHQVANDAAWQQKFRGAQAFYREYGHLDIPDDYDNGNGKSLSLWIRRQRKSKADQKLSEAQILLLESIGMDWLTSAERDWENHYEFAKRYYGENGNLEMPCTYVDESGFPLGMWLWRIRSGQTKLKVTDGNGDQLARLREIGFQISPL
ncbi:MAG: Helicase associated domain protein [Clostridia bacterium]|nr:Helicase associated domain protein [Clostridia bacterium]